MKKLIMFILLFGCMFSVCSGQPPKSNKQYFQFEDYNWGMSMDEVKAKVKSESNFEVKYGDNLIRANFISYETRIFDNNCNVTLTFTYISKLLYAVSVEWNSPYSIDKDVFTKKILETLTEKYGSPKDKNVDIYGARYVWKRGDEWLEFSGNLSGDLKIHYEDNKLGAKGKLEDEKQERGKIDDNDGKRL